jgi:hypothetical protein
MITQISYNVLIERFKAFAAAHFLIKGFSHGDLSNIDIDKGVEFPWMHVLPVEVEPRAGSRLYSFVIIFADLPRDKETPAEYQRECISDCIKLAEDLLAEVQNGLTVFGPTVELDGGANIEVFINEFSHTLVGVNLQITLSVPWDWSACDIPADFTIGGSGSGGTGTPVGLTLQTNGVNNGLQSLLNLQQGTNVTIVDNGNGTVTINSTGGGGGGGGTVTSVALTVPSAFAVSGSPITSAGTLAITGAGTSGDYIDGTGALQPFPTIPTELKDLSDVNISGPVQNDTLLFDAGNNEFINGQLGAVAYSNDYNDLNNLPTIPAAQVNSDWNAVSGVAEILNKPTLAAVATSGDYNDLINLPFIPADLNDLNDVNTPAPTNGQVLAFNSTSGDWEAVTPSSGGSVTSVGLTMPTAFNVSGSPVTTAGTLAVTGAGTTSQYIRGDGTLANFPSTGGGGGQIFYFNGNISQGTIGGSPFYELGTAANTGPAANFTRATTGVIARFITDVGSPNHLIIPSGVWTIDVYLSETGGGSNNAEIVAVLKVYNGATFTTIATSPLEQITNGSVIDLYTFALSVPNTVTAASDRVAIEFDIQNTNGKTVTLYTEDGRIGEVHSTYAIGLSSLNGLTDSTQTFATGTAGTDFAINSAGSVHTFNLPTASASNRGALSSGDWTAFNNKLTGNALIIGATKTKITYDAKGLVTAGADLAASDMPTGIDAANIGAGSVSNTEFGYLDGVSSAIQTQLNGKQATIGLTTVGTNLATLANPSAITFLRVNADNTVTARTAAEMVSDLGISSSSTSVLYQFANGDTLAAGATRFGSLFGGSANHNASDAVRRTPMITNGTLTRLYVMISTAQPATGSLVCTVRKNSIDQALTLTIAAGSAAGVFTDLVNSVSVAVGDQMGMKFVNNASGTSAAILNNQVLLTI